MSRPSPCHRGIEDETISCEDKKAGWQWSDQWTSCTRQEMLTRQQRCRNEPKHGQKSQKQSRCHCPLTGLVVRRDNVKTITWTVFMAVGNTSQPILGAAAYRPKIRASKSAGLNKAIQRG